MTEVTQKGKAKVEEPNPKETTNNQTATKTKDGNNKQQNNNKQQKKKRPQRELDMSIIPTDENKLKKFIEKKKKELGPKPNRAKRDKDLDKIKAELNGLNKRIKRAHDSMEADEESKKLSDKMGTLKAEKERIKAEIKKADGKLEELKQKIDLAKQRREDLKSQIEAMKNKNFENNIFSKERITDEIAKVESEISSSTHDKRTEALLVRKLAKLEGSVQFVEQLENKKNELEPTKQAINAAYTLHKKYNDEVVSPLYKKLREVRAQMSNTFEGQKDLRSNRSDQWNSISKMRDQRTALHKKRENIYQKFLKIEDAYYDNKRYIYEAEKRYRDIEYQRKKAEREAERARIEEEKRLREEARAKEEEERKRAKEEEAERLAQEEKEAAEAKREQEITQLFNRMRNPHADKIAAAQSVIQQLKQLPKKKKKMTLPISLITAFANCQVSPPKSGKDVSKTLEELNENISVWEGGKDESITMDMAREAYAKAHPQPEPATN